MVFGEFGICDVFSEHSQHRLKQAVLLSRRRVVDFLYQRNFPILAMAPMDQPLLAERSKLSMVYGVNEYEEMLRTKMTENSEIAQLKAMSPDQEGPKASAGEAGSVLKSGTEANGKSKKGKREFPTPNKPDPMPRELEFLFTRISPEQMLYMWNVYTALFCAQCACVLAYCFMLSQDVNWYLATAAFGVPMAALMIQNVYILHDVLHGATFPPYWLAEVHYSLLGWSVFFALGGVGVGAPETPRQHSGLVGSRRVRLGPSNLAVCLAGMDRQMVWLVDSAIGACMALDWCQRHWSFVLFALVRQLPRSRCRWQVQQGLLGQVGS